MDLVYLHGFASGPMGRKAGHCRAWCAARNIPFHAPDLNLPDFEHLTVLSAATGDVLFSYKTALNIWGSPSIADGTIYVGDQSGTLYAFSLPAGS